MSRRSYAQPTCGLAVALDQLGERWTLLIARELVVGPLRYTDLLDALPGIGTNLLATRLKHLEEIGVVSRRVLPPPAASTVYELTERGRRLEPVLDDLTRWGQDLVEDTLDEAFEPRREAFALRAMFRADEAAGTEAEYQFEVGAEVVHARVTRGRVETGLGPLPQPKVVIRTDAVTWAALLGGRASLDDALDDGAASYDGDQLLAAQAFRLFRKPRC